MRMTVNYYYNLFYALKQLVSQKQLWKYNLAEVDVLLQDMELNVTNKLKNLRLLRSSKESDFIYLPIQVSDFQIIQQFMPVEK